MPTFSCGDYKRVNPKPWSKLECRRWARTMRKRRNWSAEKRMDHMRKMLAGDAKKEEV